MFSGLIVLDRNRGPRRLFGVSALIGSPPIRSLNVGVRTI